MTARSKALYATFAILASAFALSFPAIRLALEVQTGDSHHLTFAVVRVLVSLVLCIVACAVLFGGRFAPLSFAFFLFALSRAAQPASVWGAVLPASAAWAGAALAATVAGASVFGFVALCLRVPTGVAIGRWRYVDRALPWYSLLIAVVYGASLVAPPARFDVDPYRIYGTLLWIAYFIGLIAYLARFRSAAGEELVRMRWVALAIAAHVAIEAAFLFVFAGGGQLAGFLFMLNPAPYAFAYALVQGRIVDVRGFGGRAVVYAMLTSLPIAAVALADWFFARRLADVKLASAVEISVAVAFSFWLQTLHRRIDRFVERVFFARRHRAHAALERIVAALAFVERLETIETMLVTDVPAQLDLYCAAMYRHENRRFVKTASAGCDDLAN